MELLLWQITARKDTYPSRLVFPHIFYITFILKLHGPALRKKKKKKKNSFRTIKIKSITCFKGYGYTKCTIDVMWQICLNYGYFGLRPNISLPLSLPQVKIIGLDPDETDHDELSHLDLRCIIFCFNFYFLATVCLKTKTDKIVV